MRKYNVNERRACEKIMKLYGPTPDFACDEHSEWSGKIANRIIINIFFNDAQKDSKDAKRKGTVKEFKKKAENKMTFYCLDVCYLRIYIFSE